MVLGGGGGGKAGYSELLAICRWSYSVLQSRLTRVWVGDATLPFHCHATSYLFQPSRLPSPFLQAARFLPQVCNCTGIVGCKFPRAPDNYNRDGVGRLQHCRIEVEDFGGRERRVE